MKTNIFSFEREHRLIHQTTSIEVADRIVNRLKDDTPQTQADVEKMVDGIRPEERSQFEESFKKKLDTLPEVEREQVRTNLGTLARRSTKDSLKRLQQREEEVRAGKEATKFATAPVQSPLALEAKTPQTIQTPAEMPALPVAAPQATPSPSPQAIEAAKPVAKTPETPQGDMWLPEQWTKPSEWTPKQWATVTVGGAIAAVVVGKLWNWMRGGNKKTESTPPSSGWGWKWLWGIPFLGLAVYGAAEGYKAIQKFKSLQTPQGFLAWLLGTKPDGNGNAPNGGDKPPATLPELLQPYVDRVAGAVGLAGGAATEAVKVGGKALNTGKEGLKTGMSFINLQLELLRGNDTTEAFNNLTNNGCSFIDTGKEFLVYWGTELKRLPREYATKLHEWLISGKGTFRDFAWVAGELGTLYVFNDAALNLILNGRLGKFGWMRTPAKIIGAPLALGRDAVDVVVSSTLHREATIAKLKSRIPFINTARDIRVRNSLSIFANGPAAASYERMVNRIQGIHREIDVINNYMKEKNVLQFGPRFSAGDLEKLERIHDNAVRSFQDTLKGMAEPAADAPPSLRKLWTQRNFSSHEFRVEFGKQMGYEANRAGTAILKEPILATRVEEAAAGAAKPTSAPRNSQQPSTGPKPEPPPSSSAVPKQPSPAPSEGSSPAPKASPAKTGTTTVEPPRQKLGLANRNVPPPGQRLKSSAPRPTVSTDAAMREAEETMARQAAKSPAMRGLGEQIERELAPPPSAAKAPIQATLVPEGGSAARTQALRRYWETVRGTPGQTALWGAGVALNGYMFYNDVRSIDTVNTHVRTVKEGIKSQVEQAGFRSVDGNTFKHSSLDITISLKDLQSPIDAQSNAQYLRTAASGASLATTLLMGPALFSGPGIFVVAGVEVAVRTGIRWYEQKRAREFLLQAPPWLLAALGTSQTTGEAEYDWLVNSSSWMLSDVRVNPTATATEMARPIVPGASMLPLSAGEAVSLNQEDHEQIRRKMLFTLFLQETRNHAPGLFAEISEQFTQLPDQDRFFHGEFRSMVLPFLAMRLFALSGGKAPWESLRDGNIDQWWRLGLSPYASVHQLRQAARESAVFYVQHLREKRYRSLRSLAAQATGNEDREALQQLTQSYGKKQAFGVPLERLVPQAGTRDDATRALHVLQQASVNLNTTKNPSLAALSLNTAHIAGLPAALDLTRKDLFHQWVDDPVLRANLATLDAWEGKNEQHLAPEWQAPSDQAMHVAIQNAGIASAAERSQAIEADIRRGEITSSVRALLTQGEPSRVGMPRQDIVEQIAKETQDKGDPVAFARLDAQAQALPELIALCRRIAVPNVAGNGLIPENLQAIFLEAKDVNGLHVALATHVYRVSPSAPDGKPVFRIVQRAATSQQENKNQGNVETLTQEEFLRQPGAAQMLSAIEPAVCAREEERRARNAEEQRAVETERQATLERAKKVSDRFVLVPGNGDPTYRLERDGRVFTVTVLPPTETVKASGDMLTNTITFQPEKHDAFAFAERSANGTEQSHAITRDDILREKGREFYDVLIAPLEGNDRESLFRIIRLFSYDVYRPDAVASVFANHHNYRTELLDALLPLYQQAGNKRLFLRELLMQLVHAPKISDDVQRRLAGWFRDHEAMFRTKESPSQG